ncbi:MAG TPA: hypothetical protein VGS19_09810 [Streptosporangiaceae bacterium]|nr:hypothetical protein [Streptosporangiaceae bacterium]
MRGPSRRELLGGAAGVVAAAALPAPIGAWSTTRRVGAATRLSTRPAAIGTGLAGATVGGPSGPVPNAQTFDGYIGMPLGTTLQKIYFPPETFPQTPPAKMTQLAKLGCQFLVNIQPSTAMTSTEQNIVAQWLARMNKTGMKYGVVLFSESNNKAFASAADWQAYWSFYAPVVQSAGVSCAYDAGCSGKAFGRAEEYFPTNPNPDELWLDYYATSFRGGARLEPLIAMGQSIGISSGIAEWGWTSGNVVFTPMTMPWWNEYCAYLVHLASTGGLKLGSIYFDDIAFGRTGNFIGTADDLRIPGIRSVSQAIQAGG